MNQPSLDFEHAEHVSAKRDEYVTKVMKKTAVSVLRFGTEQYGQDWPSLVCMLLEHCIDQDLVESAKMPGQGEVGSIPFNDLYRLARRVLAARIEAAGALNRDEARELLFDVMDGWYEFKEVENRASREFRETTKYEGSQHEQ